MPHVSGHNPGSSGVGKSLRPRVRPRTVPVDAFPKMIILLQDRVAAVAQRVVVQLE